MTDIQNFAYAPDSAAVFEAIRDLPNPVLLDSGKPLSLQGRFDIISAAPLQVLETRNAITQITDANGNQESSNEDPFLLAQRVMSEIQGSSLGENHHNHSLLPFTGGLIGSFSYSLGSHLMGLETSLGKVIDFPDMRLGFYPWALIINHQIRQASLVFDPACPAKLKADIKARLSPQSLATRKNLMPGRANKNFHLIDGFEASINKQDYFDGVSQIKRYIAAGDCYQANYAQHFSAAYEGDPWYAYQYLRRILPSPFSAYLEWDGHAVLSLSPERFLKVANGMVETRPIKGSIPRGRTVVEDEEAAATLLNSTKDRAENLMIVDLLRNDLGKSCHPGSIRVPKLFGLESFANVHHLVSTVTGKLLTGETPLNLLTNCFPGGSITGAPKKRSMEIIAELEILNRALYCGSIGYVSTNGRMDTNIVIRTLLADGKRLHCWGGGGIVADSDPETEYQETIAKVGILMSALKEPLRV